MKTYLTEYLCQYGMLWEGPRIEAKSPADAAFCLRLLHKNARVVGQFEEEIEI